MRKVICPFCKEHDAVTQKGVNSRHIYYCNDKPIELSKTDIKLEYIKINWPELATKEGITFHYIEQLKSLPDLQSEFNIPYTEVYWVLEHFGVKKRTISESNRLIGAIKSKSRWQKEYGVDNISQIKSIQEKKKATTFKNYGVDNIWKWEGYNEVATKTMLKKYGVKRKNNPELTSVSNKKYFENLTPEEKESKRLITKAANKKRWDNATQEDRARVGRQMKEYWDNLTDDEKNERLRKSCCLHTHISSLEIRISIILKEMGIEFVSQKRIAGKIPDFVLSHRVILEVQGDYWHATPLKYKKDDVFKFPGQKLLTAEQIWQSDLDKKTLLESRGYNVIYIWENEMVSKTDNEIKDLIIQKLIKYENKIN